MGCISFVLRYVLVLTYKHKDIDFVYVIDFSFVISYYYFVSIMFS